MPNALLGEFAVPQDRRAGLEPDPRLASSITIGAAFAVMLVLVAALTLFRSPVSAAVAVMVMAAVVAGLACPSRLIGALVAAGLGWLMLNGFVEDPGRSAALARDRRCLAPRRPGRCAFAGAVARSRRVTHQRAINMTAADLDEARRSIDDRSTPIDVLVPYQRIFGIQGEQRA